MPDRDGCLLDGERDAEVGVGALSTAWAPLPPSSEPRPAYILAPCPRAVDDDTALDVLLASTTSNGSFRARPKHVEPEPRLKAWRGRHRYPVLCHACTITGLTVVSVPFPTWLLMFRTRAEGNIEIRRTMRRIRPCGMVQRIFYMRTVRFPLSMVKTTVLGARGQVGDVEAFIDALRQLNGGEGLALEPT